MPSATSHMTSSNSAPPRPSRSERRPSIVDQGNARRRVTDSSQSSSIRASLASDFSDTDPKKRDSVPPNSSHNRSLLSRVSGIFREKGEKEKTSSGGLARTNSISQASFVSRTSDRNDIDNSAASPRVALVRAPQHLALAHLAPSPSHRVPSQQQPRRSSASAAQGSLHSRQSMASVTAKKSPASSLSSGRSRQKRREREVQPGGLNKKSSSAGIVAATYGAAYRLSEFQTTYSPSGVQGLQSAETKAPSSTTRAIFAPEDFSSGRRSRKLGQSEPPSPMQLSRPSQSTRRSVSPGKRNMAAPLSPVPAQPRPQKVTEVTSSATPRADRMALPVVAPVKTAPRVAVPPIITSSNQAIVDLNNALVSPLSAQPHVDRFANQAASVLPEPASPLPTKTLSANPPNSRRPAKELTMPVSPQPEVLAPAKQLAALPPLTTLADFCLKAGLAGSPFAPHRQSLKTSQSPPSHSIGSPHLWSLGDSPGSSSPDGREFISSGAVASAFAKAPGGLVNAVVKDEQARIYLHAFNACASIGPTAHAASLLRSLLDAGAKGAAAVLLIEGDVILLERVWDGQEPDNLSEKMLEILQATEDRDDDVRVYLTSSTNVSMRAPELHVLDAYPVTSATGQCIGAMTVFGSSATPGGSGAAWTTLSASLLECVAQDISQFLEGVRRDVLSQRLDALDYSLSEWTSQVSQTSPVLTPAASNLLGLQPQAGIRRPTSVNVGTSTKSERNLQLALRSISDTLGASLAYVAYVCEEPLACCVLQTMSAPGALAPAYLMPDPEMHHAALSATRKGLGIERDIGRTHALLGLGEWTTSNDALHSALVVPCITSQMKGSLTPPDRMATKTPEAVQGWTLGVAFASSLDSLGDDPATAPSPLTPEAIIYLLRFASLLAPLLESNTAELGFTEVQADTDLTVADTLGLSPPVIAGLSLRDNASAASSAFSHGDSSGRATSTQGQHSIVAGNSGSSSTEHSSNGNSYRAYRSSSINRSSAPPSVGISHSLERARDIARAKRSRQASVNSPPTQRRRGSILSSTSSQSLESTSPGRPSYSSAFEVIAAEDNSSAAHDRERTMSVSSIGSDMRVQGSVPSPTLAVAAAFASPFFKASTIPGAFDEHAAFDPALAKLAEEASRLHAPGSEYPPRSGKGRFSTRSRSSSVSSAVPVLPPRPGPPPSSDLPLTPAYE